MSGPQASAAELEALAARVERLGGSSAEERQAVIDAYNMVFPHELLLTDAERGDADTRYHRTMHRVRFETFINTAYDRVSLDAAMSLVPEGYDWIVGDVNGEMGGTPYACVGSEEQHFAATPILSLCCAALRARAHAAKEDRP